MLTFTSAATPPATAPAESVPPDFGQDVRDLGSDEFAVRERATQRLWAAGAAAEGALKEAAAGDDPEAASRARRVLRNIRLGVRPDTAPDVLRALEEFDAADPEGKRRLVRLLYEDPRVRPALCGLWVRALNHPRMQPALGELAQIAAADATVQLAGDVSAAEVPLELAMAAGGDKPIRDYAAYLLATGGLPRAIARWQGEFAGLRAADRVLAYLHRAAADPSSAAAAAARCGDASLRRNLLIEAGDYPALIRLAAQTGAAQQTGMTETLVTERAELALWHRAAGEAADADRMFPAPLKRKTSPRFTARVALMHGRSAPAAQDLAAGGETAFAAAVLAARLQFADALRVADTPVAVLDPEAQLPPQIVKGAVLHRVGRAEEAARVWDEAFKKALADGSVKMCAAVIRAEREAGPEHEAAAAGHAVNLLDNPSGKDFLRQAFGQFSDQPQAELVWFEGLRLVFPHEPREQTLRRTWAVTARRLPDNEAGALASKVATATVNGTPAADRLWWLEQLGHLLRDAGDYTGADRHYSQMLYGHNSPRGMFHRADLALRRRQWSRAADLFVRAYQMDPQLLPARYLQGAALAEAGRKDEGHKRMESAAAQLLSDEGRRAELAQALEAHGLPQHAAAQRSILLRTGAFDSPYVVAALRRESAAAEAAGDFVGAAVLLERFIITREAVAAPVAMLEAVAASHRLRARAASKAGDAEAALREAYLCLDALPGDVESAVSLVKDFDRAGRNTDADLVFHRVAEALKAAAEAHPKAEFLRDDLARLRKECRRN